ncbi:MAG: hypothetical protein IKY83_09415 [Proteobacteria bacterium]|nr:hypothetical protein [Pseudomonadota bacterium]
MRILNFAVLLMTMWLGFAGSAFAEEALAELSAAGHAVFDDLIEGRASLERCAEGDKACAIKLEELHKKIRAEYAANAPCEAQFRYHFYEIDCGADELPDLLLQYRGTCIYDRSADEMSGRNIMIYRDGNGKYRVGSEVEFWERSSFEFTDRSFYRAYGSCGAECHSTEIGFIDDACKIKKISTLNYNSDENIAIVLSDRMVQLADVTIQDTSYYSLADMSPEDADRMILSARQVSKHLNKFLPDVFKIDMNMMNNILTTNEIQQKCDDAMNKYKSKPRIMLEDVVDDKPKPRVKPAEKSKKKVTSKKNPNFRECPCDGRNIMLPRTKSCPICIIY